MVSPLLELELTLALYDGYCGNSNNDDANYIEDKEQFIKRLTGKPPEDLE